MLSLYCIIKQKRTYRETGLTCRWRLQFSGRKPVGPGLPYQVGRKLGLKGTVARVRCLGRIRPVWPSPPFCRPSGMTSRRRPLHCSWAVCVGRASGCRVSGISEGQGGAPHSLPLLTETLKFPLWRGARSNPFWDTKKWVSILKCNLPSDLCSFATALLRNDVISIHYVSKLVLLFYRYFLLETAVSGRASVLWLIDHL